MAGMTPKGALCIGITLLVCGLSRAQDDHSKFPKSFVIASDSFIDVGPPFDYYELIRVAAKGNALQVEKVSLTPPGDVCFQPARVESESVVLHESMGILLGGKSPCAISERELHRELKRRKNRPVFSGVNVTMLATCGGKQRTLRMDILDRDMFDPAPHTPENTSWTMALLKKVDDNFGPGPFDRPMFPIDGTQHSRVPDTPLVRALRDGKYDALFGKNHEVSTVVHEADLPIPPPPSVAIESVTPYAPLSPTMPIYPPIAKVAHVQGLVKVTFAVGTGGAIQDLEFVDAPRIKMLEMGVRDAISKWRFPKAVWGQKEQAVIRFSLNC
jgi:TonB family protein